MLSRLPDGLVRAAKTLRKTAYRTRGFAPPRYLTERMGKMTPKQEREMEAALRAHYFTCLDYFPDPPDVYLKTDEGRGDLRAHLDGRLETFRSQVVPWLDSLAPIKGQRVLEVGCGTGSSTLALVEQGASVVATDIHEGSIITAKTRLGLFGLSAEFQHVNAINLDRFEAASFDMVALFAVLEHMTTEERLSAIAAAWKLTKPGGRIIVIESPNRLWAYDSHTSDAPFVMWLPDDIAIRWSRHTPRDRYNRVIGPQDTTLLARWGRGVSYHDFSLALDIKPDRLPVESCMDLFYREKKNEARIYAHTWRRRYEELIVSLEPSIHRGFFQEYLNLSFKKSA